MTEEYNKYVPNDAMSCGDTLMYNAERLANGELSKPVVKFCIDVQRKDGSIVMMCVYICEAGFASKAIDGLDWQKRVEEVKQ